MASASSAPGSAAGGPEPASPRTPAQARRPGLKLPASYALAVSPRQRWVAAAGRRSVVVACLASGQRVGTWPVVANPSHLAFADDERTLAVKSTWGEVALVGLPDGAIKARHRPRQPDEGAAILFSPCGRFLVEGAWSGAIRVRSAADIEVTAAFDFPDEMIVDVSTDAGATTWLFGHEPKAFEPDRPGLPPYLTVWTWPLQAASKIITLDLDTLEAAVLDPTARHVAVVGRSAQRELRELCVLSLDDGRVLSRAAVAGGGTGAATRWSADGRLLGTVAKGEVRVYRPPLLEPVAALPEPYPADLAFLDDGRRLLLGSWTAGRIVPLAAA